MAVYQVNQLYTITYYSIYFATHNLSTLLKHLTVERSHHRTTTDQILFSEQQ